MLIGRTAGRTLFSFETSVKEYCILYSKKDSNSLHCANHVACMYITMPGGAILVNLYTCPSVNLHLGLALLRADSGITSVQAGAC